MSKGPRCKPLHVSTNCRGILYEGTKDQLVEKASIPLECFAGIGPAPAPRRSARFERDGREIRIYTYGKYRYMIQLCYSEAERKAADEKSERNAEIREQRDRVEGIIGRQPKSLDEARSLIGRSVEASLRSIESNAIGRCLGGYSLDRETGEEIQAHLAAIWDAVAASTVCYSKEYRQAIEADLRASVIAKDPDFAGFMRKLNQ